MLSISNCLSITAERDLPMIAVDTAGNFKDMPVFSCKTIWFSMHHLMYFAQYRHCITVFRPTFMVFTCPRAWFPRLHREIQMVCYCILGRQGIKIASNLFVFNWFSFDLHAFTVRMILIYLASPKMKLSAFCPNNDTNNNNNNPIIMMTLEMLISKDFFILSLLQFFSEIQFELTRYLRRVYNSRDQEGVSYPEIKHPFLLKKS